MTFLNEEDILKTKPRAIDEDDWPIFRLQNVTVRDASAKPASLFSADGHNKLCLDGLLKDPKDIDRYTPRYIACTPAHKRHDGVYVRNVDRFSYGRFDDGEAAVWAAGKAGWFEIQPSREYKSVYRDMVESIDVYYFVVDKYQPQRPAKSKQYTGSTEMLFAGYVKHTNGRCASPRDAEAIFHKHRKFIISNMIAGKADITWTKTPLYAYMKRKFQSDFAPSSKVDNRRNRSSLPLDAADPKKDTPIRKPHQGKSTSTLRPKGTKISTELVIAKEDVDIETDQDEGMSTPTKRKIDSQLDELPQKRAAPGRRPTTDQIPAVQVRRQRLKVVSRAIPGTATNGPGDSWKCEIDGCMHKVYAASTDANKVKIEDHYKEHAEIARKMIDLVLKESNPHQPATYLTTYIAEKTTIKSTWATLNSDKIFPRPIDRRV